MIYDCYKDMHLSGDRAFPLKGTYNTLNMSLRHVTRHAGCRSIRRSIQPGIHLPRRSRSRRAYRWKPYRRCWDINISPRPKFTPKSPTTRSDKIWRHWAEKFNRVFKVAQQPNIQAIPSRRERRYSAPRTLPCERSPNPRPEHLCW